MNRLLANSGRLICLAILVLLCAWVAVRLGALDLTSTVVVGGEKLTVPNSFANVDHPFHATRGALLLDSLRGGRIPRWVSSHQGGYPVEFYPFGVAWIDVGFWALLFGQAPILAVHKLTVIAVFLLPAISFWMLARADNLHPAASILAMAIHLGVAHPYNEFDWLTGGYSELVSWGLVTNVAGGSLSLTFLAALSRYVLRRERPFGAVAVLAAAGAAMCNPRSLFALVVIAVGVFIALILSGGDRPMFERWRNGVVKIVCVGVVSFLLASPLIVSLLRFSDEYFFLHYQEYADTRVYWERSILAVTQPVVIGAIAGTLIAFLPTGWRVARASGIALIGYVGFTLWVMKSAAAPGLIQQLEAPRLMPFQRQLMIWMAVVTVMAVLKWVVRALSRLGHDGGNDRRELEGSRSRPGFARGRLRIRGLRAPAGDAAPLASDSAPRRTPPRLGTGILVPFVPVVLAVIILFSWVRPVDSQPLDDPAPSTIDGMFTRELNFPVETSGTEEFAWFREAVKRADAIAPEGTAIFVVGNTNTWWHEQLWAPAYTDRRVYADDWLWYWTSSFQGPYDPSVGYYFPNPTPALSAEFFETNGIGAVIVTDMPVANGEAPREAAKHVSALTEDTTFGTWDVYAVKDPVPVVTRGDVVSADLDESDESISATFNDGSGPILIRQNWFERWRATVNGDPAHITRLDNGYMQVDAPNGAVELRLEYPPDRWDWSTRVMAMVGRTALVAILIPERALRRGRDVLGKLRGAQA